MVVTYYSWIEILHAGLEKFTERFGWDSEKSTCNELQLVGYMGGLVADGPVEVDDKELGMGFALVRAWSSVEKGACKLVSVITPWCQYSTSTDIKASCDSHVCIPCFIASMVVVLVPDYGERG